MTELWLLFIIFIVVVTALRTVVLTRGRVDRIHRKTQKIDHQLAILKEFLMKDTKAREDIND
jgi:hypothetical protein